MINIQKSLKQENLRTGNSSVYIFNTERHRGAKRAKSYLFSFSRWARC